MRLGQLTDVDKMGLEWLQRVFGEEVLQFVMILFTYEAEEESHTITDDLKKKPVPQRVLEKCGGRYQTCSKIMNNQYDMKELTNKIDLLFMENKQQHYTVEMYNTAREREGLQKSQCGSGENVDLWIHIIPSGILNQNVRLYRYISLKRPLMISQFKKC